MENGGNVVVITGANNGIGLHAVEPLLQQQYRVAVLDLSGENVETLLAAYQEQLVYRHCDVSKETDVAEAIAAVMDRWGRIDILVNNAAVCDFTPFVERSIEQTRREFEVNYFGYLRMIQAVLPHMRAQGKGRIHNVSSGVGITGFSGISGYSSTKGAIEALSRTLSIELAPYGVSVHLMHPPLTNTKSSSPDYSRNPSAN
jgi:NAD(P)-dependent dehydrogenase (short-subunit alcohol dehydrogenase family)